MSIDPEPEQGIEEDDSPIASLIPEGFSKIIGFGERGQMIISEIQNNYPKTFENCELVLFDPLSKLSLNEDTFDGGINENETEESSSDFVDAKEGGTEEMATGEECPPYSGIEGRDF